MIISSAAAGVAAAAAFYTSLSEFDRRENFVGKQSRGTHMDTLTCT